MLFARKLFNLGIAGALVGALLAMTTPPTPASAKCTCDDTGFGMYQCNGTQTACISGAEVCNLKCQSK
jgi:hypothetical protein